MLAALRTLALRVRKHRKSIPSPRAARRSSYKASSALMPASSARFLGGARLSAHARSEQLTSTCAHTAAGIRKLYRKPVCFVPVRPLLLKQVHPSSL